MAGILRLHPSTYTSLPYLWSYRGQYFDWAARCDHRALSDSTDTGAAIAGSEPDYCNGWIGICLRLLAQVVWVPNQFPTHLGWEGKRFWWRVTLSGLHL